MTLTLDSRKRPRSSDECDDFIPISKRINNLHIRSNPNQAPGPPDSENNIPQAECSSVSNGSSALDYSCQRASTESKPILLPDDNQKHPNDSDSLNYSYLPELGANENPYYYHINNLLFQAHFQRLQRLNNAQNS